MDGKVTEVVGKICGTGTLYSVLTGVTIEAEAGMTIFAQC